MRNPLDSCAWPVLLLLVGVTAFACKPAAGTGVLAIEGSAVQNDRGTTLRTAVLHLGRDRDRLFVDLYPFAVTEEDLVLAREKGWGQVRNSKPPVAGWDWNPYVQIRIHFDGPIEGSLSKTNIRSVSLFLYHFEVQGRTLSLSGGGLGLADGIVELESSGVEPGTPVRIEASLQLEKGRSVLVELAGTVPIVDPRRKPRDR